MTTNILKANDKYAYRLSLRGLPDHEKTDPVHGLLRKDFDRHVANNHGRKSKLNKFTDQEDIETPHHDLYDDEHEGGVDPILNHDDLGNQNFDNYLDVQLLLPFVEDQQKSKVKWR